jgi:UDP-2,4-diacetamido-2,4,6-trideoxy-beta-L-altropyranose hydrolase
VVLSGYQFDTTYQHAIRSAGHHLLVIDDFGHAGTYCANLVVNQNIHATRSLYPSLERDTHLLLGTAYALLRLSFLRYRTCMRCTPPVARNLLITFGGSDPANMAPRILASLEELAGIDIKIDVVAGPDGQNWDQVQHAIGALRLRASLQSNVTDMSGVMGWADMAVSAGGSTSLELAFMGVPTVSIAVTQRQLQIVQGLEREGFARSFWYDDWERCNGPACLRRLIQSPGTRKQMSRSGRRLVDGLGATRVLTAMGLLHQAAASTLTPHAYEFLQ